MEFDGDSMNRVGVAFDLDTLFCIILLPIARVGLNSCLDKCLRMDILSVLREFGKPMLSYPTNEHNYRWSILYI